MKLTGTYDIPAPRETVWQAMNDPEVLRLCVPGCEALEQTQENTFTARVTAKVGPVKAKFKGKVTLSELDPPKGYTISGEGQGGPAGFAKGGAQVHLEDKGEATTLTYNVEATVGGKLAQMGQRLIDQTARKMADEFFGALSEHLGASPNNEPQAAQTRDLPTGGKAGLDQVEKAAMVLLALIFAVSVYSQF